MSVLRMVPLDSINEPPNPMRSQFGDAEFAELVESIRVKGILEPLLVRPAGDRFEVMAGHRRTKAARVLALPEVPCIVKECSDAEAVEVMIHENTGREDVSAAEEGWFYLELVERFKLNESQLCSMVRKSVGYINERIDLVREDPEIALAVAERQIKFTIARELLRVNHYTMALAFRVDPATITEEDRNRILQHRRMLLNLCVSSGANGKTARMYVEQWKAQLVPIQPYSAQAVADAAAAAGVEQPPRCVLCGRDSDPQNFVYLPVHKWEKAGVLKILRSAGIEVYE